MRAQIRAALAAHGWLAGAGLFVGLATLVTLLFAVTPLDIQAARLFYRPGGLDHWPFAHEMPWSLLYRLAPYVTAVLVLAGLGALAAGLRRGRGAWRRRGVFLLLSIVLGPGIVVNTLFKDHWNRPRPRDIVELGGASHYRIAPLPGGEGGASFPCGHCSVGFLCASGWWMWRQSRPRCARASLAFGLIAGFLLGLGRMAAGGHFLSDVVWSALLALGIAHLVHHAVEWSAGRARLAVGALARAAGSPLGQHLLTAAAALGGVAVLVAVFATPHGTPLSARIPLASLPATLGALQVAARKANVDIVIVDRPAGVIEVDGELHGFGLPTSRLESRVETVPGPTPTLRYEIVQHGVFTDLDGLVTLTVPLGGLRRVAVRLERGNIRVRDMTAGGAVRSGRVRLDLHTASGRVDAPIPALPPPR